MSDPRRFLDDDDGRLEGDLFRAALDDAPTDDVRARAAAALGLDPRAPSGGGGGGAPAPLGPIARPGWLRWGLGVAAVGGAILVGLLTRSPAPPGPRGTPPASTVQAASPALEAAAQPIMAGDTPGDPHPASENPAPPDTATTPLPATEPVSAAEADAPRPPLPRAPSAAAPSGSASAGRSLAEEVASLDRARASLASAGPAAALRELDRHQREFPKGALSTEALVLRIEALARAGRRGDAVAAARAFLRASPGSPYGARIRSLVPEVEP